MGATVTTLAQSAAGSGTHWAAALTAIGSCVTGAGIVFLAISARSAGAAVREAERTRNATFGDSISSKWEGEQLKEARQAVNAYATTHELCAAYVDGRANQTEEFYLFLQELNFFEDLAAMEKLGFLGLPWIRETMKSVVVDRWAIWETTVREHRRIAHQPTAWENFEGLAAKLASPPKKKWLKWRSGET